MLKVRTLLQFCCYDAMNGVPHCCTASKTQILRSRTLFLCASCSESERFECAPISDGRLGGAPLRWSLEVESQYTVLLSDAVSRSCFVRFSPDDLSCERFLPAECLNRALSMIVEPFHRTDRRFHRQLLLTNEIALMFGREGVQKKALLVRASFAWLLFRKKLDSNLPARDVPLLPAAGMSCMCPVGLSDRDSCWPCAKESIGEMFCCLVILSFRPKSREIT